MAKFVVTWDTNLGTSGPIVVLAAHSAIPVDEPSTTAHVDIRPPVLANVEHSLDGQPRNQRPVASYSQQSNAFIE